MPLDGSEEQQGWVRTVTTWTANNDRQMREQQMVRSPGRDVPARANAKASYGKQPGDSTSMILGADAVIKENRLRTASAEMRESHPLRIIIIIIIIIIMVIIIIMMIPMIIIVVMMITVMIIMMIIMIIIIIIIMIIIIIIIRWGSGARAQQLCNMRSPAT